MMAAPIRQSQARPTSGGSSAQDFVAIVDDDPHIAEALIGWLEFHGLCGLPYASGESLLQALHGESGQWTLSAGDGNPVSFRLAAAVLDLNLPGIPGFELAATLRRRDPGLPLVIITALREDERARYGTAPSGVRCLKKPFDLDTLEDLLLPLPRDSIPGQSSP